MHSAIFSAKFFIGISWPVPIFTGSLELYLSVAITIAFAQSSAYINSRVAIPVPQQITSSLLFTFASTNFFTNAGIT